MSALVALGALALVLAVIGVMATLFQRDSDRRSGSAHDGQGPAEVEALLGPASPGRMVRDFSRSGRPLVVDTNSDGVGDLVVWESKQGAFLAIDGASGKLLWASPPVAAPSRNRAFAYVALRTLVVVRGVEVSLIDLAKGHLERTFTIDDNAALPCRAASDQVRLLLDSDEVATIDKRSGQVTLEKKGAHCDEEASDARDRQGVVSRRYFPVSFLPASVEALRCGSMKVSGSYEYLLPDPCGPKIGVAEADLGGFGPHAAMPVGRGHLLLGQRDRGRRGAMVGRVEARKLVWSSPVSSVEAPMAPEESANRVALLGQKKLAVLSSSGSADVVVTFDVATGKRDSQATLPSKGAFVAGVGSRWLVLTDSVVLAVDPADGKVTRWFE